MGFGYDVKSIGDFSSAMGSNTTASGDHSTAMGNGSIASGDASIAIGFNTMASGDASAAMGYSTNAKSYASLLIGRFNDTTSASSISWVNTDPLFVAGNGVSNNNRNNAFTLLKNGNTGIGTAAPLMKLDSRGSNLKATSGAFQNIFQVASKDASSPLTLQMGIKTDVTATSRYAAIEVDDAGTKRNLALQPSSGNVGIGITNPQSKLHVNGEVRWGNVTPPYVYSNTSFLELVGTNVANSRFRIQSSRSGDITNYSQFFIDPEIGFSFLSVGSGNGNVGIGCSSPEYKLHVIGDIASTATVRAANFIGQEITSCSDSHFKQNITPLQNSMENILKLQGVNYFWKTKEFPERNFNDKKQIGLIAQEVEKILPELVFTDKNGYKSVDYSKLTPILVEAIKELSVKNDKLRIEIENLKESFEASIENIKTQFGMEARAVKIK